MIEFFIRKQKITLLFFMMIIFVGVLSFFQLPHQEIPEIAVNRASVTTAMPGASAERVEQTVTKEIEERIKEIQGLKSITSGSQPGISVITVETNNGVDPKEKWDELRKKVKDAEAFLPVDARQPVVNDDMGRMFAQTFMITADSFSQLGQLRETMTVWKNQLGKIPGVANVTVEGLPEQEIEIKLDPIKLQVEKLGWAQVQAAIKAANETSPLGNYTIDYRTYELKMTELRDLSGLEQVVVGYAKHGNPIYLKQIAEVNYTTKDADYRVYHNNRPALSISLMAEQKTNIPGLQKLIDAKVEKLSATLPVWATAESLYTQNERINEIFSDLWREMLIAVVAVLVVCTLGLNFTTSLMVALAIPISLATGMIFLPFFEVTLNQITIVGLIIVLGILVDDAVVVNDNIERRLVKLGEKPYRAAALGAKEVSISIVTATLATVASFGPLLFLSGGSGAFVRPIPVIIIVSMIASMVMSLTIIPIFRRWSEERRRVKLDERKPAGLLGKQLIQLSRWYSQRVLPRLLKKPLRTGMIAVLISTLAYFLIPLTPIELFPVADRDVLLVNVKLPYGSSLDETNKVIQQASEKFSKAEGVWNVSAFAGGSAPKIFGSNTGAGNGVNIGQMIVRFDKKKTTTHILQNETMAAIQKQFPEAVIVPRSLQTGPSVGKPVVIRVYGENITTLRELSQKIQEKVVKVEGITDMQDDLGVDRYSIAFETNQAMMERYRVTAADLSRTLRLASEGIKVSEFDDGKQLTDITLYLQKDEQAGIDAFQQFSVTSAKGELIPLTSLVTIQPSFSVQNIPHKNLDRTISITGELAGRTATEVMKEIKPLLAQIPLPDGYFLEYDGETSAQVEVFIDMGKLSIIVVFLIVILIAMQFYSLRIPVLVMSTVYLAISGSLIGLFVTRTPLGFMTMMGIVSLSGIVVRNGIVLVEFIEQARKRGLALREAVIEAGEARFRPILLTSMTAIAGLLPLAISGDELFKPLAVTIISGLFFSTMFTLVVVPSFYTVMEQRRMRQKEKRNQKLAKNISG
ncbi:efflux RND transporter permease subunit [uncultured Brevibacillus sp.]|uniref:efflux RND transporter permease subunit n=1 Tax=uncultured Brevibacillus sp. TaxID=169970 RepID=UPI00259AD848|nr:efflux RND transporter permease subunit [uncultured Brevibacillus sp.]